MRDFEVHQAHRVRASHEVRYFTLGGAIPADWLLLGYVEYFGFTLATRSGDESVATRMYASRDRHVRICSATPEHWMQGRPQVRRFAIDLDLRPPSRSLRCTDIHGRRLD
jgi:hypothetical protein